MTKLNEYINGDKRMIGTLVKMFGVDVQTAAKAIDKLDFADYVEIEDAINKNDKQKVAQLVGFSNGVNRGEVADEAANPYAPNTQPSAPMQRQPQPAPNGNVQSPSDLFKKGDKVTFTDNSGEKIEGELEDPASIGQARVKTDTGSKNVDPTKLELNTNTDDAEIARMQQLAGITAKDDNVNEVSTSGGATAGAITSGAIAGAVKGLNTIEKETHINKKPGPKPKKKNHKK